MLFTYKSKSLQTEIQITKAHETIICIFYSSQQEARVSYSLSYMLLFSSCIAYLSMIIKTIKWKKKINTIKSNSHFHIKINQRYQLNHKQIWQFMCFCSLNLYIENVCTMQSNNRYRARHKHKKPTPKVYLIE